jgi:hypothetical protein
MTISFESTEEDAAKALSYINLQSPNFVKNARGLRWSGYLLLFISIVMLLINFFGFSFLTTVMGLFYILIGWSFINQKKLIHNKCKALVKSGAAATLIGPQEFSLTPQGIKHQSNFFEGTYFWSNIKEVIVTEEHIAFHFSTMQAFLIPKRAFSSPEQGAEFMRLIEHYRHQSTGVPIPQITRGAWWTQGQSVTETEIQETQRNQQ